MRARGSKTTAFTPPFQALERHDELAVGAPRQAILGDRRSCHVTTDAQEGGAIVGGDEDIGVKRMPEGLAESGCPQASRPPGLRAHNVL